MQCEIKRNVTRVRIRTKTDIVAASSYQKFRGEATIVRLTKKGSLRLLLYYRVIRKQVHVSCK